MPISKSAKKSLRVSIRKTAINRHRKALVKEALKKVEAKNAAQAVAMIDKSAKWGLIHPNKANRLKSNLMKKIGSPLTSTKTKAAKPAKAATKAAPTKTKKTAVKKSSAKKTK